ncbi:MAG: hypothetical protein D6785_00920 [Planctomycetota bacterium]|nr:MAG: hypothetical protein D6785_00920 [Planctomycetota bacterium]
MHHGIQEGYSLWGWDTFRFLDDNKTKKLISRFYRQNSLRALNLAALSPVFPFQKLLSRRGKDYLFLVSGDRSSLPNNPPLSFLFLLFKEPFSIQSRKGEYTSFIEEEEPCGHILYIS